nr:RNA-directed DNA polymerase, eukaryota [Tanacetum cinerariifolium]
SDLCNLLILVAVTFGFRLQFSFKDGQRSYYHTNEDRTQKISPSVYVTNFPDSIMPRDLWSSCSAYGTIVDVFISFKKSKAGKRFAFVRFIKVVDLARLMENLCTIWIGRHHLYANQVRFERPPKPKRPTGASVKPFHPLVNLNGRVGSYANVVNGRSLIIHGPLIPPSPALVLDDTCLVERDLSKYVMGKVKDFMTIPNLYTILKDEGMVELFMNRAPQYLIPQALLLRFLRHAMNNIPLENITINIPMKFRRRLVLRLCIVLRKSAKVMYSPSQEVPVESNSAARGQNAVNNRGLILGVMEDVIRVGQAMGYTMEGCMKKEWVKALINSNKLNFLAIQETKMSSVSHLDVKFLWGNSNYDFVCSDSLGSSGGILCIWEASIFKKDNVTISDNFIAIYGTWLPNNAKILFVAVYAPQQGLYKRILWDYISTILSRWNGESIIMGDFNEVRSSNERRGSCFNPYNARCFDRFISNSGLVDINMKGYAFTWSHPSIFTLFPSITAICLDRHLSNHRPILLFEVHLDFGPIPFRFYHSWFEIDGFEDLIKRSWLSFSHSDANRMIRFKKRLQDLKVLIRQWIKTKKSDISSNKHDIVNELREIDKKMDHGEVDEATVLMRFELKNNLIKINDMEAKDNLQKSKVKWAIEGDENSKFFHGIINKRRSQLAIRGNCGDNKSPGPDGFTFEFFKRFWDLIGADFCDAVNHFFVYDAFSNGCNSSFIALIPKVIDAKFVNDFRPISLIGCIYKVVTKVLANRLVSVIQELISDTEVDHLKEQGFDFRSHCKKRIGNGIRSLFRYGYWISDVPLYAKFPRLFALELNKVVSVADKLNGSLADSFRRDVRGGRESHQMETLNSLLASVSLSNSCDRWFCDLAGDGEFRVNEVRNFIDDLILPSQSEPTRWGKLIPMRKMCIISSFAAILPGLSYVAFVRGGIWVSTIGLRSRSDMSGLLRFVFLPRSSYYWRRSFVFLGGLFGSFEIALFLKRVLPNARRFLMILFFVLLIGVLVVLVENFPFLG